MSTSTRKIVAGLMGLAMVLTLAVTVKADAVTGAFDRDLTVGSSGADVTALQTLLVSKGDLVMPAGVSMGYFGSLTQTALATWQASVGVAPAVGYFGPITRAAVAGLSTSTTSSVPGCAAGASFSATTGSPCVSTSLPTGCTPGALFSSTTGASCTVATPVVVPGCAVGATFSATTGASCTTGTVTTVGSVINDGTDGSLTASQSSYVSSGIQLKKGDTKDILAMTLKSTDGGVTITRADVHFNTRPWLIFSQVTLHDSTGKVIATKTLSSDADATEITVGSDYLVRFDNINYTVPSGAQVDLVVGATVLSATDKITNGEIVNVVFGTDSLRTINGKGWTDSLGSADNLNGIAAAPGITQMSGSGENNFNLTDTGSVADIDIRVSPNSPDTRQVATSLTQTTSSVVLGVFSLKSANDASTLNTLQVNLNGVAASSANVSNVRLLNGSTSYGGNIGSNGLVTFNNLNIPLAQDTWQDLSVQADIAEGVQGIASTSLQANTANIVVTDANYNTATVEGTTSSSVGLVAGANPVTFTTNAVTISSASATLGSAIVQGNNTTGYNANATFTINNTSNNDLYVSATSTILASQTINGVAATTTGFTTIQSVTPSSYSQDTTGANASYVIPSGLSRTFTLTGTIRGSQGSTNTLKITSINYGTSTVANALYGINFGLDNLSLTASF